MKKITGKSLPISMMMGGRACIASVSNSEMELQIYRSKDFYELATFYEDFTNKKYDFFKFQIDNNDPWIDDSLNMITVG